MLPLCARGAALPLLCIYGWIPFALSMDLALLQDLSWVFLPKLWQTVNSLFFSCFWCLPFQPGCKLLRAGSLPLAGCLLGLAYPCRRCCTSLFLAFRPSLGLASTVQGADAGALPASTRCALRAPCIPLAAASMLRLLRAGLFGKARLPWEKPSQLFNI